MLVKCSFGDDIRRFTIDHPFTTFSGLEHQLSNLYKIPRGSFRIFYTDNEGDKILISTNEELSAAVAQANGPNILRLTIETIENSISEDETKFGNEDSKELPSTSSFTVPVFSLRDFLPTSKFSTNQSIGTNTQVGANNASTNTNSPQVISSSTNTRMLNLMNMGTNTKKSETATTGTEPYSRSLDDVDMDELFSNPKFQERLATILAHAIATRTFSQLLQNMIPQMTEILKESIKETSTPISLPSIDQIEVEMNQEEEIPPNISLHSITESSSFSSSSGSEDSFEIDLPEISENNFEDESNMEYENNMEEENNLEEDDEEYTFEEETPADLNPTNEEPIFQEGSIDAPTTTEEPQVLYQNEEETVTEVEEPEQFVIVENTENTKPEEKKENSPFHSFLSLFKSSQKKTPQPRDVENLDDVEIPNLEDLLTQLESMGFTDKEQNIKALRFHKRFNEGIDEVVEELLQQS